MPLTCNIDAKGKRKRLLMGLALLAAGVLLALLWAWPSADWKPWAVVSIVLLMGGFALFEARAGWCAMRAMGFKTKY
jgi:hypothetical protein